MGTAGVAKGGSLAVKKVAKESLKKYIASKAFKTKVKKALKTVATAEVVGSPRVVAATIGNQLESELGVLSGSREERESL